MDPQGHFNLGENTPPFNLAEIWPFNGGAVGCAAASSFHDGSNAAAAAQCVADNISRSMNVGLNVNLVRDPMVVMEQQAPNSITNRVKRRLEEDGHSAGGGVSTSCDANMMNECNNKRIKTAGGSNENLELKADGEANKSKSADQKAKTADLSKQDYIHVRARRGQATDSHSLAERARREKISERMKTLQDLVPGCNKVIGKALVLDEIINYVQSLQRQVEFLSMKLEAVTSRLGPGIEGFPLKDFGQPPFEASGMPFGPQSSGNYDRSTSPEWLHMQIGGGFDRTT